MIILIAGTSHTGKTLLAQKLLEKYAYPYLSIDHLKMGLIRSGQTKLTPENDDLLTEYLWPIVAEIIKTNIENQQNIIIEGCYIPFDWQKDFTMDFLPHIKYKCLIMSESYIKQNINNIKAEANAIESRLDDSQLSEAELIKDNAFNKLQCEKHELPYILIDEKYNIKNMVQLF